MSQADLQTCLYGPNADTKIYDSVTNRPIKPDHYIQPFYLIWIIGETLYLWHSMFNLYYIFHFLYFSSFLYLDSKIAKSKNSIQI